MVDCVFTVLSLSCLVIRILLLLVCFVISLCLTASLRYFVRFSYHNNIIIICLFCYEFVVDCVFTVLSLSCLVIIILLLLVCFVISLWLTVSLRYFIRFSYHNIIIICFVVSLWLTVSLWYLVCQV